MSIKIEVREKGKVRVRLPYAPDNRAFVGRFITGRVGSRWDPGTSTWTIDRGKWIDCWYACQQRASEVEVWHTFRTVLNPGKKCTEPCSDAPYETVYACTCTCGGVYHGVSAGKKVAECGGVALLIVGQGTPALVTVYTRWSGGIEVERTIVNVEHI